MSNEAQNIGVESVDLKTEQDFDPHTWAVIEGRVPGYERYISVVNKQGVGICRVTGAGSSNQLVLESVRANARLIAAAPALYDALTTLLDTETNLNGVSGIVLLDAVDKARAALALVDKSVNES